MCARRQRRHDHGRCPGFSRRPPRRRSSRHRRRHRRSIVVTGCALACARHRSASTRRRSSTSRRARDLEGEAWTTRCRGSSTAAIGRRPGAFDVTVLPGRLPICVASRRRASPRLPSLHRARRSRRTRRAARLAAAHPRWCIARRRHRRALIAIWAALGLFLDRVLKHPRSSMPTERIPKWFEDRRTSTWNSLAYWGSMLADTYVKVGLIAASWVDDDRRLAALA